MKKIYLSRGKTAIVDDEDFDWLNQWKWYARKDRSDFRAVRNVCVNGKWTIVYMHRIILGLKFGDGILGDHRNHNTLDNRRFNLRVCTKRQNQHNRKPQGGTLKYKGVIKLKGQERWKAQIRINGKKTTLGYFNTETEAAQIYNSNAKKVFGKFAYADIC